MRRKTSRVGAGLIVETLEDRTLLSTGIGREDIGAYDPKSATWSLRLGASAGAANAGVFKFGAKYALPVAGDWNGDGKDGIGTFEPGSTKWTLRQTASAGSANAGSFK